jgi:hypothetical protein
LRHPGSRTFAIALGGAAFIAAAFAASCFQAPGLDGLYRCTDQGACPEGYTCDDGVCCNPAPGGAPECPSYVKPDGRCSDGGTPRAYFPDLDDDGYGASGSERLLCHDPATYHYALDGGDCNDDPAGNGAAFHPGALEVCDGLDNNCNGQRDEGFTLQTYWRDQDSDTYGDPLQAVQACQQPTGYVTNNADCEPDKYFAHPGGTEICNGVDDDCNQTVDDIPEKGQACTDSTRVGACQAGTWQCSGAAKVCQQSVFPQLDVCDTVDNNCNGVPDEPPDCGGPTSLALDPGVVVGARKLSVAWFASGSAPPRCLRSDPAGSPSDAVNQSTAEWTGSDATTHVYWAQAPAGATWDLTQTGKSLHLLGYEQIRSNNSGSTNVWFNGPQPWVMLCGPSGFIRLTRSASLFSVYNSSANFDETFPVRGGGGSAWSVAAGSSSNVDAVLKRVDHIEILVEPQLATGGSDFYFDFSQTRMGFP